MPAKLPRLSRNLEKCVSNPTLHLHETIGLLANGNPWLVRIILWALTNGAVTLYNPTDNQALMMSNFASAMAKMAITGQDRNSLIDCSEVIPMPVPPLDKSAT